MSTMISVFAPKGGTGKTTMTLALMSYIHTVLKKTITIVDLDPQGTINFLKYSLDVIPEEIEILTKYPENCTSDFILVDHSPDFKTSTNKPFGDKILLPITCQFTDFISLLKRLDMSTLPKNNRSLLLFNKYTKQDEDFMIEFKQNYVHNHKLPLDNIDYFYKCIESKTFNKLLQTSNFLFDEVKKYDFYNIQTLRYSVICIFNALMDIKNEEHELSLKSYFNEKELKKLKELRVEV